MQVYAFSRTTDIHPLRFSHRPDPGLCATLHRQPAAEAAAPTNTASLAPGSSSNSSAATMNIQPAAVAVAPATTASPTPGSCSASSAAGGRPVPALNADNAGVDQEKGGVCSAGALPADAAGAATPHNCMSHAGSGGSCNPSGLATAFPLSTHLLTLHATGQAGFPAAQCPQDSTSRAAAPSLSAGTEPGPR